MGARGPDRTTGRALPLGWDDETAPAAAPAPDGAGPQPEPRRLSRRARRFLALCCVLALLAALLFGLPRLLAGAGSPQQVTADFLRAVIDGDLETVRARAEDAPDASAAALSAQVLEGADDRLESFEIRRTSVSAGTATVTAALRTGTTRSEATFTLTAADTGPFSAPEWELAPVALPEFEIDLPVGAQGIEINGVAVPLTEHGSAGEPYAPRLALQLLPGTYEVTLPAERAWLAATTVVLEAPPRFEAWRSPVHGLHFALDDDGRAEVERRLHAVLEECAAGVSPVPVGCPFVPPEGSGGYESPDGTWTLTGPPQVDVIPTDAFLWLLHGEGTAEFTPAGPEADGGAADGADDAEPREVRYDVDATAALDDDGDLEVRLRSGGTVSYGYCVDAETGRFTGVVVLDDDDPAAPGVCG
jgi:hypothetical protein